MARIRRGAAFLAAVALTSTLCTIGLAQAGVAQRFTDVPASHPFFSDINAVSDACIAAGYDDGSYKPSAPVTRQAMAAFLRRAASKTVTGSSVGGSFPDFGTASLATYSPFVTVAQVVVTVPDLPGNCNVPVELHGNAAVFTSGTAASTCHSVSTCNVQMFLFRDGSAISGSTAFGRLNTDSAGFPTPTTAVVDQPDGTTRTYTMQVRGYNVKANAGKVNSDRSMYAVIHPIGMASGGA